MAAKPKILVIVPFTENICLPLLQSIAEIQKSLAFLFYLRKHDRIPSYQVVISNTILSEMELKLSGEMTDSKTKTEITQNEIEHPP